MNIKAQVVRFEQTGGPEVLRTETIELPDPAPGEVRIRHTAIGLNFAEIYLRTGRYPAQGKLPSGLGNEGAGVVEKVGPGATGFKEGDRVCYFGGSPGSYSTHRNMGTERLIHTPAGISDEVAAAALLKGMTVEYLLNRCYRLQPGQDALFHAASGGVGLIAGQWGQHLGARMIGVAGGADKCKLALVNGYAHVIDRTREDIAARVKELTKGAGVPVVFDSVGEATFGASIRCLSPRGMFVSFGTTSGPVPPVQASLLQQAGSLYFTRPTLQTYVATREELLASSTAVFDLIVKGAIRISINARYPLEDVREAHMALEAGRTIGSSILVP